MATEGMSRQGKMEVYGVGQYLNSQDINFDSPYGNIKTKMDDTGLGGFGIAYHFNDFFSVHGDLMFGGATFSGETASGWQSVTFSSPVPVSVNTTYIASYFSPSGYFALDTSYFNNSVDNPPLHAPTEVQRVEKLAESIKAGLRSKTAAVSAR